MLFFHCNFCTFGFMNNSSFFFFFRSHFSLLHVSSILHSFRMCVFSTIKNTYNPFEWIYSDFSVVFTQFCRKMVKSWKTTSNCIENGIKIGWKKKRIVLHRFELEFDLRCVLFLDLALVQRTVYEIKSTHASNQSAAIWKCIGANNEYGFWWL